jgi:hypothetical protein
MEREPQHLTCVIGQLTGMLRDSVTTDEQFVVENIMVAVDAERGDRDARALAQLAFGDPSLLTSSKAASRRQ